MDNNILHLLIDEMDSIKEPKHNFNRILKVCDISRYPELASEDYQNGKIKIKEQPHMMAYLMSQIKKVSEFTNDTDEILKTPCICGYKLKRKSYTCLVKSTGKFIILGSACIENLDYEAKESKSKGKSVSQKTEILKSISGIFKDKLHSAEYTDIDDLNEYCDDIKAIWLKSLTEYVEFISTNMDEKKYAALLVLEEYLTGLKEFINCEDFDIIIETIIANSLEYRKCINKLYDKKKCVVCNKYHTNHKFNKLCEEHISMLGNKVNVKENDRGEFNCEESLELEEFKLMKFEKYATYLSLYKYISPNFVAVQYYYWNIIFKSKEELYFDIYSRFINHIFNYTKIPDKEKYLEGCFMSSPVFKEDGILYKQIPKLKECIDIHKTTVTSRYATSSPKCLACNGTGIAYWCDDIYGECFECGNS